MLKRPTYTKSPKIKELKREVVFIDVKKKVLGRVATEIAFILQGKNKVDYISNLDIGDYVVVTNAKHIKVTGNKKTQKLYGNYSGYQGGLKQVTLETLINKNPIKPLEKAIKGMLPDNKLKKPRMKRLFIFPETEYSLPKQVSQVIKTKA